MGSVYLNGLSPIQRKELESKLLESQAGKCFICEKELDLELHAGAIDIDHIEPSKLEGRDDPSNFAVTHESCNRSKQANDLRVARVLARFKSIRDEVAPENRGPNLSDILRHFGGAEQELNLRAESGSVCFAFPHNGQNDVTSVPLYHDNLSDLRYFFAKFPIKYLFHDDRINPRSVGGSLNGLIEEFHKKRPQLQVALGWIRPEDGKGRVHIFDGQHKVTAQVLLGVREIPLRVFFDPDLEVLLSANTNAGTTLRQIAFDKSVQRHLGSALFLDRLNKYRHDRCLPEDAENFSEQDLVDHFKGEWREMRRYILDSVRDSITHHPENKLKDYIDFGGRGQERPLSYSTIEKTFYSFFIFGEALETRLDAKLEEQENPRELEKAQILRLMNIIGEKIYIGHFDPARGTAKIENLVQKGEDIPEPHLRAFRMSREEIMHTWLRFISQIVQNHFIMMGKPLKEKRLFQYPFPDPLWNNIENFVGNLAKMPLWVNRGFSTTVFGGKQNYDYWETVFETGKTREGQQVLTEDGINIMDMIQA
jgi:HNH endonuclease